jgi:hypothetical protein
MNDILAISLKYSKYAYNLDRLFKSNSLENLKKNLKNPKKFKINEFDFSLKEKLDKFN